MMATCPRMYETMWPVLRMQSRTSDRSLPWLIKNHYRLPNYQFANGMCRSACALSEGDRELPAEGQVRRGSVSKHLSALGTLPSRTKKQMVGLLESMCTLYKQF